MTANSSVSLDLAFSVADYAIFGIMLVISFGIGVYHASKSSKNNEEFVMGSRSFGIIPMAISLCASFNSAYMILGIPSEIYSHGTQFYIMILGTGFGVFVAAELWLPILYRIQVVSIYEYFELRYRSKFPRILMTLIFVLKVCNSATSLFYVICEKRNVISDMLVRGHCRLRADNCVEFSDKLVMVALRSTFGHLLHYLHHTWRHSSHRLDRRLPDFHHVWWNFGHFH